MSPFIIKNGLALYEGFNMSGLTNQASLSHGADIKDTSTLVDDSRLKVGGLLESSVALNGFWDSAEGKELFESIGSANGNELFSYIPAGGTIGNRSFSVRMDSSNYTTGTEIGEVFPFTFEGMGDGPLIRGLLMENQVALAASADGTSRQFAALAAADSMYCGIHVTSFSGTSLIVTIESDDDGSYGAGTTTRMTSKTFSAIGSDFLSVAGAITDTHWRAVMTIVSGTVDVVITLGISDK